MKRKSFVYLLITLLILTSCKASTNKIDPEETSPVSQVELILHADSENEKKVGMGMAYDLQIKNYHDIPIEFDGLLNDGREGQSFFAFSSPNVAHLIAPDGQDLFAVYSQDAPVNEQSVVYRDGAVVEQFDPFRIEANSERWQPFYLGKYANLTQAGTYTFWVELEDNLGQLHQSNKVSFTLDDIEPSVPLESLELELRLEKDIYTIDELGDVWFEYSFKNTSEETVIFLRRIYFNMPVQSPLFQYVVQDKGGRIIPIAVGEAPRYIEIDESQYIALHPGEERFQTEYLSYFPGMYKPGEYRIQLVYIVYEDDILSGEPMNWDKGVFTGRLESNEVIITIVE